MKNNDMDFLAGGRFKPVGMNYTGVAGETRPVG